MDFGTLLHMAKKNSEESKNESKFYCTKFAPPKKETKEKKLSANIQKFLQKREQEEREREQDKRQKLANLLAMRDEKSKNKIKKMLKVTKSANKSVLEDAVDADHIMTGPDQLDQDDYGYVSNEANAFYQKYIEKVKDVKEDKGFAPSRPQSLKDLTGTKERVKAAITREIEEKKGNKSQRSNTTTTGTATSTTKDPSSCIARAYTTSSSKSLYDPEAERREEERKKREEDQKRVKNRRPPPPPMDFQALLKLAEKKQHEPIEIVTEVKKKEPERLLTSKEKREMEERQRAKEARERRDRERATPTKDRRDNIHAPTPSVGHMEPNGRIPKLNQSAKQGSQVQQAQQASTKTVSNLKSMPTSSNNSQNISNGFKKPHAVNPVSSGVASSQKNLVGTNAKPASLNQKQLHSPSKSTASHSSTSSSSKVGALHTNAKGNSISTSNKNPYNGATREFPPRDIKTAKVARQVPPMNVQKNRSLPPSNGQKPRQLQPADVAKTRAFPPTDVQRSRQFPPQDTRWPRMNESKKSQPQKRRIIDDEEYDSEMDDFIDDGDCEEDYSSHIKAIFGYDKSKYRDLDDDDDTAMESNFAQVQREEYISKKIGLQEDLEDMRLEAMEKRRKALMKKRRIQDDEDDD